MTENTYFIAPGGAESGRLVDQEHLFTKALGGLFPPEVDTDRVEMVLDLACGPGEWANEVAFHHPHISVVGVDIDPGMVEYARAFARVAYRENVDFEVMDVKEPLVDFPENSFDMINGRLLFGFMDQASWPRLVAECRRLLRPGGMLCLCEYEVTISNSASLQYVLRCLYKALADQKRTYSIDRQSVGICHMLDSLLVQAGFVDTAARSFHLDSSYGKPLYDAGRKNNELALELIKPFLLKAGGIEQAEYETLQRQMQLDMLQESYLNISFGLQAWGYKP